MQSLILLGSTGSIGTSTLKVVKEFGIPIEILGAGRNIKLLNQQIKEHSPKAIIIQDRRDMDLLDPQNSRVYIGEDGMKEAILESSSPILLNAISGGHGLYASILAQKANKTIALANKESLVSAGWLLDIEKIIPIDSEHFSLWYLLRNQNIHHISQLLITASGGAFRDCEIRDIPNKKSQDALKHPNWKMGSKITIDSASMVNKLFEILEAHWLFRAHHPHIKLDAIIERNSSVHALITHVDGSYSAHISHPDMRLPISYLLDSHKASNRLIIPPLEPSALCKIQFENIDTQRYPVWNLKSQILENPKLGIALNAANEILTQAFLENKIPFGHIATHLLGIAKSYEQQCLNTQSFEDLLSLDLEIKAHTAQIIGLYKDC